MALTGEGLKLIMESMGLALATSLSQSFEKAVKGMKEEIKEVIKEKEEEGGQEERGEEKKKSKGEERWRRTLDMKDFERIEKFRGGEEEWRSWAWQVKVAIRAQSAGLLDLMTKADEKGNVGVDVEELMVREVVDKEDDRYNGITRAAG